MDTSPDPVSVVLQFNQALNDRDLERMKALLTPDTVFENTSPPPDGRRYAGREAVLAFWEAFFAAAPVTVIESEEVFGLGARAVMRWRYRWVDHQGREGTLRGVDVYTLREGLIAEKLSYVKG